MSLWSTGSHREHELIIGRFFFFKFSYTRSDKIVLLDHAYFTHASRILQQKQNGIHVPLLNTNMYIIRFL